MTPLNTRPNPTFTLEPTYLKRWTVQDYHRMSELGILDPNERTELIAGQITLMAAKGTPHVTSLHLLANALRDQLGSTALIRTQDPIQLDDFSEPEPDLAIVKGTVLDYAHGTEPSFSLGVSQFHSQPHLHPPSSLLNSQRSRLNVSKSRAIILTALQIKPQAVRARLIELQDINLQGIPCEQGKFIDGSGGI